ncbi:unnamed protein product [Nesidiocoris tenuis]|uniref:C2H2-type domain-containing protein n=1 Tax=Nesidiocoris tenuis TaxID=355587 RepID=A0A6H5GNF8_9HEMI|nr:unnamed protein product [Nesidiocoris tenuis]
MEVKSINVALRSNERFGFTDRQLEMGFPNVGLELCRLCALEKDNLLGIYDSDELACCNQPAEVEPQELLPNVEDEFIREKNNEYDPLGEESDADARGSRNNEEWENTSNWLCTDCSEVSMSNDDENMYLCSYDARCRKMVPDFFQQFNNVEDLREHHRSEHNQDARYMLFSNKKVCNTHKLVHSDLKPAFVCSACGKSFKQQSSLFYHARCHLPEEVKFKYPCDLCKKRFKTGMQLRKHHSVHTGAKPHQCDVCGRTFREKGTLREHHRIHTGAMPFACEYCGKTFRFKGILTTHRRQHTGERPYSCYECQHHFTNWPNYNKHMKRRHGINTSRSARPGPKEADNPVPLQQPAPPEVSTSAPVQQTQEAMPDPAPQPQIYQEIQPADLYGNISSSLGQASPNSLPTYMAYNVYSLSHLELDAK